MDEKTFNGFDHIWYYRIGSIIVYAAIFNSILPNLIDLGRYLSRLCVQLKDRELNLALKKVENSQKDD